MYIFPFYLKQEVAAELIQLYAYVEFQDGIRFYRDNITEMVFNAKVDEDGSVELSAWRSYRSTGISGAGTAFEKTVTIPNELFAKYVEQEKLRIAIEQYYKEKAEEERRRVSQIYDEIFPEDRLNNSLLKTEYVV